MSGGKYRPKSKGVDPIERLARRLQVLDRRNPLARLREPWGSFPEDFTIADAVAAEQADPVPRTLAEATRHILDARADVRAATLGPDAVGLLAMLRGKRKAPKPKTPKAPKAPKEPEPAQPKTTKQKEKAAEKAAERREAEAAALMAETAARKETRDYQEAAEALDEMLEGEEAERREAEAAALTAETAARKEAAEALDEMLEGEEAERTAEAAATRLAAYHPQPEWVIFTKDAKDRWEEPSRMAAESIMRRSWENAGEDKEFSHYALELEEMLINDMYRADKEGDRELSKFLLPLDGETRTEYGNRLRPLYPLGPDTFWASRGWGPEEGEAEPGLPPKFVAGPGRFVAALTKKVASAQPSPPGKPRPARGDLAEQYSAAMPADVRENPSIEFVTARSAPREGPIPTQRVKKPSLKNADPLWKSIMRTPGKKKYFESDPDVIPPYAVTSLANWGNTPTWQVLIRVKLMKMGKFPKIPSLKEFYSVLTPARPKALDARKTALSRAETLYHMAHEYANWELAETGKNEFYTQQPDESIGEYVCRLAAHFPTATWPVEKRRYNPETAAYLESDAFKANP